MTTWIIRRHPLGDEPNPSYPWQYTYLPEEDDCGAGGHYGEVESLERALEAITQEAAEHVTDGGSLGATTSADETETG